MAISGVATQPLSFEQQNHNVIEQAGGKILGEDFYTRIGTNGAVLPDHQTTPEEAARQWKICLNPKRDYLFIVLERSIRALNASGIQIIGKTPTHDIPRLTSKSVLDESCEPKIMWYCEGPEQLRKVTSIFDRTFTKEEYETFGCPQGTRNRLDGTNVPQWGPSFMKMRNRLFFYQQGGYIESGRKEIVGSVQLRFRWKEIKTEDLNAKLDEEMSKRFTGENYYLHKGTSDPLL